MQVTHSTCVKVNHNPFVCSCALQLSVPGQQCCLHKAALCQFVDHLLCLSSRAYTGVGHLHMSQACKHHPFLLAGGEQPCPPPVSEYHTAWCLQDALQTDLTACWRLTLPGISEKLGAHTVERR